MSGSSFVDPGKMRNEIASQKAREKIEKAEEAAEEEAAKKKSEEAEQESGEDSSNDEDQDLYASVWGPINADQLLKKYPEVAEMVRDKRYFLTGYATQTIEFGGQNFTFRTLKKSEQRLCLLLAQDDDRHPVSGDALVVPDEFIRWQMLLMLKSVGGEEWDDLQIPTASAAKRFKEESEKEINKFVESEEVLRRLKIIGDWPEQLYDRLAQHCQSINMAYSVAIERDLKNP